jgi:hypothetical protein
VFVNPTVAGPYMPLYVPTNWVECFTSKLSTDVKMTGISVNSIHNTYNPLIGSLIRSYYGIESYDHLHIQSTAFSLDREGLDLLLRYKLFHPGKVFPKDKTTLIYTAEIAMSTILRYERKSLYSYRMEQGLISPSMTPDIGDLWHIPKVLFPLCEMMFVKTNTKVPTFPEKERYDSI